MRNVKCATTTYLAEEPAERTAESITLTRSLEGRDDGRAKSPVNLCCVLFRQRTEEPTQITTECNAIYVYTRQLKNRGESTETN